MEADRQPACLSEEEILHIAERIARRNHLPKINTRRLHRAYEDPDGHGAYILWNDDGMLWMDRYYVAFTRDDSFAQYVYIAQYHLAEEMEALKAASDRSLFFTQAAEARYYFREPAIYMSEHGTEIWVAPEFGNPSAA